MKEKTGFCKSESESLAVVEKLFDSLSGNWASKYVLLFGIGDILGIFKQSKA